MGEPPIVPGPVNADPALAVRLRVTKTELVAVQPLISVTVTVYVVVEPLHAAVGLATAVPDKPVEGLHAYI